MKVTFAPLHYVFGKNFGSEMICAHELFTRVSQKATVQAISLFKLKSEEKFSNLTTKTLIDKPFFPGALDTLKLVLYYSFHGLKFIYGYNYHIIHHVFPFRIGRTFNPLFFLPDQHLKKIIGPIMVSVEFENKDTVSKGSFFTSKNQRFIDRLFLLLDPLYSYLSRHTLLNANVIIALNLAAKGELVKFGIPSAKIIILPIGIDITKFRYTPYKSKYHKRIELLTLGYLNERKGTDLCVLGLNEMIKENKQVHLTIVGDGPQRPKLEAQVAKLHLQNYVTFSGFVDYNILEQCYRKSHILINMSRAESWGQMYINAMACGLPVIATKNMGSNEIVIDGKTGYLVEQEDYQTLAEKTISLIKDSRLLSQFGQSARKAVETKYDWDQAVIPQYLKLYLSNR